MMMGVECGLNEASLLNVLELNAAFPRVAKGVEPNLRFCSIRWHIFVSRCSISKINIEFTVSVSTQIHGKHADHIYIVMKLIQFEYMRVGELLKIEYSTRNTCSEAEFKFLNSVMIRYIVFVGYRFIGIPMR